MSAPRISIVSWSRSEVPGNVFESCRVRGKSLFIVEESGVYGGRRFRAGELLVCSDRADARHGGVLVPRGRGRARLGVEQAGRLLGDSGEVCSSERWLVAGGLEAIVRPMQLGESRGRGEPYEVNAPRGWVVEPWLASTGHNHSNKRSRGLVDRAQLSLFDRALAIAA